MILREFQKNNKIPIFVICLLDLSKTIRFSYWVNQIDILRVREKESDNYPEKPVLRALPELANYTENNAFR